MLEELTPSIDLSRSVFILPADEKFISLALADSTCFTVVGKSQVHFICVQAGFPYFKVKQHTGDIRATLSQSGHTSSAMSG